MPHAEDKMSKTQVVTNGDQKSQFLSHLTSYPIVSDSIDTVKSNQYGAKSIEIADAAYTKIGKPIEPHLRVPYSYAKPYVNKADSLADNVLTHVDNRFPIVKEDTNTIFGTAKSYAFWPIQLTFEGKDYVVGTWHDEYKKTIKRNNRGPGLWSFGLSIISTEMRIASDALQIAADWLGPKKDEAKQKAGELLDSADKKGGELINNADKKVGQLVDSVSKKSGEAVDGAKQKSGEAVDGAKQKKDGYSQKLSNKE